MYIKIRKIDCRPDDEDLVITVTKATSIDEIQNKIEKNWKIEKKLQKLFYKGKQVKIQMLCIKLFVNCDIVNI